MIKKPTIKDVFEKAAAENLWGDNNSKSGPGSSLFQTAIIKKRIPEILAQLNITKMLDAPCGDFFWMKDIIDIITSSGVSYTGVDIVKEIIESDNKNFGNSKVFFFTTDITEAPIPRVDLIMTRDCFIHLSYDNILKILSNFRKSGSKYLLLSTYTHHYRKNRDADDSTLPFRALNMQKFPFSFRKPLIVINEGCTENDGLYNDKSLAVWELDKINLSVISMNLRYLAFIKYMIRIKRTFRNIVKF